MDKTVFKDRFRRAIKKTIELAQKYVKEKIPKDFIIDLSRIDSKDTHKSKYEGRYEDLEKVIEKLYQDGSVPRWVDLNVKTVENDLSIIRCEYSNIFFNDESNLLHEDEGVPPFHILSPHIPPSHFDFDKNKVKEGKFSIKDIPKED
ncbi:MAG: hypothetical protein WC465_04630 [Patescibacteria group bacterium]